MQQPEELFESFGPAVVAEIQRHIRRSGTLGPLLRSLGLDAPRAVNDQYVVLLRYLEACGSIEFLNQVSLADPSNTAVQRRRTGVALPVVPPRSEPPPPVQQLPAAPAETGEWVTTPEYTGPERRLGVERRLGAPDRRHQLETIFKNQRYGGRERRKTIRRKEDRTRQYDADKKRKG